MTALLAMFVAAEMAMVITCAHMTASLREDMRARAEINAADEWFTRIRRAPAVGAARRRRSPLRAARPRTRTDGAGVTGRLRISAELSLPLDAVTETFGVLAVKRAGKSNAAVVIAEEMYDAGLPWVAIDPKGDWWGVRAAGDGETPGLSVLVFGGLHGDVPLEPTAGRLVADLVVDERLTCVLDVFAPPRSS